MADFEKISEQIQAAGLKADFCRALADVINAEPKCTDATEESFACIKANLWELLGEVVAELEKIEEVVFCEQRAQKSAEKKS